MDPDDIAEWLVSMEYHLNPGEIEDLSWLFSNSTMRLFMKSVISLVMPQEEAKTRKYFNLGKTLEQLSLKKPIQAPCESIRDLKDYINLEKLEVDFKKKLHSQKELKTLIRLQNEKLNCLNESYVKLRSEQEKLWKLIAFQEKMLKVRREIKEESQELNKSTKCIMEEHHLTLDGINTAKELVNNCLKNMCDEEKLQEAMMSIYLEQVPASFVYNELIERSSKLFTDLLDMFYVDPGSSIHLLTKRTCLLCLEIRKDIEYLKESIYEMKSNLSEAIEKFKFRPEVVKIEHNVDKSIPLVVKSKIKEEKKIFIESIREYEEIATFKGASQEHDEKLKILDKKIDIVINSLKNLMAGNTEELSKSIENTRASFVMSNSSKLNPEALTTSLRQEEIACHNVVSSHRYPDIVQLLANLEEHGNASLKRKTLGVIKKQMNEARHLAEGEILDFTELLEPKEDKDLIRDLIKMKELLYSVKTTMDTCLHTLDYWENNPFNSSLASINVNGKHFEDLYIKLQMKLNN